MAGLLYCEIYAHNVWLVGAAALVCAVGAWVFTGLYARALQAYDTQRIGWHFLAATAAGASIWCTHFVAILAYRPRVPIEIDAGLTVASSLVAIAGATVAFIVAGRAQPRAAAALGGSLLGLSIAAMHYLGMFGYRVVGLVNWSAPLVALSVGLAAAFGAAALHVQTRTRWRRRQEASAALLIGAIVGLHFTGMAAVRVAPLAFAPQDTTSQAYSALAMAVLAVTALVLGAACVIFILDNDIKARSASQMRQMALHDDLTGLPNRAHARLRLTAALEQAAQTGGAVAFIEMDLDDLKEVNERSGHVAGDEAIRAFATRLREALSENEFAARLGGDEFAVICEAPDVAALYVAANRISECFAQWRQSDGATRTLRASLGVAIYPLDAQDFETLLLTANLALQRATAERSGRACFYQREMDERARERRERVADLRCALAEGRLELYYQPQARVSDGALHGFEALARWPLPDGSFVSPAEFIPLAEESGLIDALGEWALDAACKAASAWQEPYTVAVNVSPRQLAKPGLAARVAQALMQSGLPPHRLELELTESAIVDDQDSSLATILAIKALGVSVALDDFGTGHSSLAILRRFPFDKIKLDRSFLSGIETDPQAKAILRAVLALGRGLKVPMLCEGVETESQMALLRDKSCDLAQGYWLGRAAPLSRLVADNVVTLAPAASMSAAA